MADGGGGREDADVATRRHGVGGQAVGKSRSPGGWRVVAAKSFYDESMSHPSHWVTLQRVGSCSGLKGSGQRLFEDLRQGSVLERLRGFFSSCEESPGGADGALSPLHRSVWKVSVRNVICFSPLIQSVSSWCCREGAPPEGATSGVWPQYDDVLCD